MDQDKERHLENVKQTLVFIANKLNSIKVDWLLGASGALMVYGIEIVPWDLDVITTPKNIEIIEKELLEFKVDGEEDGNLQLKIGDIEVEIIVLPDIGNPKPVFFDGIAVPVNTLENELFYYRQRQGKEGVIKLIEEKLKNG